MKEKSQELTESEVLTANELAIILYNDDVNSFDHVIHCLIKYCNLSPEAAEQCAFIVHYGGKCAVKHGSYDQLEPICTGLLDNGLSAKIES
jgi:ATP-dependent Clp protease adaptor protein ClpS